MPIQPDGGPDGVILADHVRCVDWRLRGIRFIRKVSSDVLDDVVAKLEALIISPDEDG